MTAAHDDDKGQTTSGSDAAAKKRHPETIADFMALDTAIGAVSSKEDGYDGPSMSLDAGRQFTEILWEKYQREKEEAKRQEERDQK